MDITPLQASITELRRERGRTVEELNAAKAKVALTEARLQRLDRMAADLEAVVQESAADHATSTLPMSGLPPSGAAALVGLIGLAAGVAVEQKRNRERNALILKVMETGSRDWEVNQLVDEMTARGFTQGLTQPHDAIRMALDRMAKKKQSVVKMGPGKYRLMSRLAEPTPQRLPITFNRSVMEQA